VGFAEFVAPQHFYFPVGTWMASAVLHGCDIADQGADLAPGRKEPFEEASVYTAQCVSARRRAG